MTHRRFILPALLLIMLLFKASSPAVDLKQAVIVVPSGLSPREKKAVQMLQEEVEKRTRIRWIATTDWPSPPSPAIAIAPASAMEAFAGTAAAKLKEAAVSGAEGYRILLVRDQRSPRLFVIGNDERGVLFGVGRLLRELLMKPGAVSVPDDLKIATAPKYPLRGHQLGYRPKCNSYDAWDLAIWEQYYRELAVFGSNAIELIPPRSDDDADSPHFPLPQMEMMVGMSRLADAYGLDVWIWYPAMDRDYSNPQTVDFALQEWGKVFQKLPRIDKVFVPGGDPGHTQPKHLMALLQKQTDNLHKFHPKAEMWVSPQSFNQAWLDEFLDILKRDQPSWLSGIVHGPQVRVSIARLRELVPQQYPIRTYPDITHSRQCQFPVPDWDVAYAVTEARECINPRPEDAAAIFRKTVPYTIGFLSYSEGCNDDVNKFIWSGLGWDPEENVANILRHYSRYFIGDRYTDDFAQGLLALERNWRGSLLANQNVETTFAQFQAMENRASPADRRNWRFQQALFRAYYDAYTRQRLLQETEWENRAMEALRSAPEVGVATALARAEEVLSQSNTHHIEPLRTWIFQLAEALFQSIRMQLSVDQYQAIAVDRGASLDTLDFPLNNRIWLEERFAKIRKLSSEKERLKSVAEVLDWTNPGPGGYYDDLGNPARQPHLVRTPGFSEDPERMQSCRSDFEEDLVVDEPDEKPNLARRISWIDHAESLYDAPLQMQYAGLDPTARYKLKVLYGGDSPKRKIRLVLQDGTEVHGLIEKGLAFKPLEFPIPHSATRDGNLTLKWFGEPGLGGNGRCAQVSEVWLMKDSSQ
jgi:hypothetical protein